MPAIPERVQSTAPNEIGFMQWTPAPACVGCGRARARAHHPGAGPREHEGPPLRRALATALLACAIAGAFGSAAQANVCDNFTGNGGSKLWANPANWSSGEPTSTKLACWPSGTTVVIEKDVVGVEAIHGGGLTLDESGIYLENPAATSTLSGALSITHGSTVLSFETSKPASLILEGALQWESGQVTVGITQGPGTSTTIGPGSSQAYLLTGGSITTASPVHIENSNFLTAGTSVTTTSTISLAPGLDLTTEGGDDGTFTAAGVEPNPGPDYGFGADTLMLTGGSTRVAAGTTLESGPLTIEGGTLQDDGTIGESTYGGTTTLATTTLTGGVLSGTGTVAGDLVNNGGTVAPGDAPGRLTVDGNYTQGPAGTLAIGLAGAGPGSEPDQLLVKGHARLAGTLSLADEAGFSPVAGEAFNVISSPNALEGAFTAVMGANGSFYGVEYEPDGISVKAVLRPPGNSLPPSISGSASVGQTLTCLPGTWSGSPQFSYRWARDGVAIAGATGSTHLVSAAEAGHTITCVVSAGNAAGSAGPVSSAGVSVPTRSPCPSHAQTGTWNSSRCSSREAFSICAARPCLSSPARR